MAVNQDFHDQGLRMKILILWLIRRRLVSLLGSSSHTRFCKNSITLLYKAYNLVNFYWQGKAALPGLREEEGLLGSDWITQAATVDHDGIPQCLA